MKFVLVLIGVGLLLFLVTKLKIWVRQKNREIVLSSCPGLLILLVHNCEKQVEGIIRGILSWRSAADKAFNLAVVDCNSSDGTKFILEKLNHPDPHYHLLDLATFEEKGVKSLGYTDAVKVATINIDHFSDYNTCMAQIKQVVKKELLEGEKCSC
ncbi:hypothetical protein RDV78_08850 [Bacillota bacterium LX-D]|nr:hypothetical protein [Bacillota bacterium LX-D]